MSSDCPPARDDAILLAKEAASADKKYRGYVFTWNNYSLETEEYLQTLIRDECKYGCYGREEAPTTGTPHLQGYLEFEHPRHFKRVCQLLRGAWVGVRRGTTLQAAEYAQKTLNVWSHGTIPEGSGRRTDVKQALEAVREGKSIGSFALDVNFQTLRHAEVASKYCEPTRDWRPVVTWIYGTSGTGKSTLARDLCDDVEPWYSDQNLTWWNGYDAHENVIINDFRAHFAPLSTMLLLLDRFPYRVPFKGGSRQFLAKQVFITSPCSPHTVYASTNRDRLDSINQLIRRIDFVIYIDKAGKKHIEKDGTGDYGAWLPYVPHDGWMDYNYEMCVGYDRPTISTTELPV